MSSTPHPLESAPLTEAEAAERAARVQRLRERVRAGTYSIDSRQLAACLLEDERLPLAAS